MVLQSRLLSVLELTPVTLLAEKFGLKYYVRLLDPAKSNVHYPVMFLGLGQNSVMIGKNCRLIGIGDSDYRV